MHVIIPRAARAALTVTVCLLVLGLSAGTAHGVAIFGFQINSASEDPLFTYANNVPDDATDNTLTTNDPVTVDLDVDLSDIGLGEEVFTGATFQFYATLTDITSAPFGGMAIHELLFDGSFLFEEAGTGDEILTVDFTGARMLLMSNGGTVTFASGLGANDAVSYTAGPALPSVVFFGEQEFGFTMTDMQDLLGGPVDVSVVPPPDEYQFEDFTFNSSFSGSAEVPEPSTLALYALAAAGWIGCGPRRRRTAAQ